MDNLRFAPVTTETWGDFEALFESPGAPKYCWCMAGSRRHVMRPERRRDVAG